MKNNFKNLSKRCVALFLMALTLCSCFATTAMAAVPTEWGNSDKTYVGTMDVTNDNMTPVKTITKSGELNLWFNFRKLDNYDGSVMIKITVYVNGVQEIYEPLYVSGSDELIPTCHVNAGDKVQIYTDVCSVGAPSTHYRKARITYYYAIK